MTHNLLFVDHAQALGGGQQSLIYLLQHLSPVEWNKHLICPAGPLAVEAQKWGVTVHQLPLPQLRDVQGMMRYWLPGAKAIAQLANQLEVDLLSANTVRAAFYTSLAAVLARRSFIWFARDLWLSERQPRFIGLDSIGKRFLCSLADRVVANSQATSRHLPSSSKVIVIHNGIDPDRFPPSADLKNSRKAFNLAEDDPVVGMVARMRPWKGQATFLRVVANVAQSYPTAMFLIVGGGVFEVQEAYQSHLRYLAQDLRLSDKVIFTGQLDDVRPALRAMNVFVHPGEPEPFGLVNLEAMAMSLPIVAFAQGALPEIVQHEVTGLLVPPGDENAMASAVIRLLEHPQWASDLGRRGRQRVEAHFSIAQTAAKYQALFYQVLGDR
jgi:glycosyltransferase involved in cell wall biosynthesis